MDCAQLYLRLRYHQNIIGISRGRNLYLKIRLPLFDAPQVGCETLSALNISVWEEKCAGGTGFAQLKPGITLAMWITRLAVNYLNDCFLKGDDNTDVSSLYYLEEW